jgi:hypothetical protein
VAYKHWTRLERLAIEKHSSLLKNALNDRHKKFYYIGPWTTSESWKKKKEKECHSSSTFYFKGAMSLVRTTFSAKRH